MRFRYYVNRETGELLDEAAMRRQFVEDYDGDDPTNLAVWDDYYEKIYLDKEVKAMEQSCKTCKHYPGCLYHSAAIFGYFIMTGRDREIPEDTSDINTSGACGGRYEADSTKVSIERINNSTKPIHYTYGFRWKGAETQVVSKEAAIKAILGGHWAHYDLTDEKDCLHLNLFSANDMM